MAVLTVRNLSDEVLRALHARAAEHGHNIEAEVRSILEEAIGPGERFKLGSLLFDIGRRAQLTDEQVDLINERDRAQLPNRQD